MKRKNSENSKKGFSLYEIIIAIAIAGIITALGGTVFFDLAGKQSLDKDTTTALSYIEKARMLTINSANATTYGIKFASSTVTIFPGTSYASATASNTVFTLSGRTTISSVSLSNSTTTFYFQRLTGMPTATGTITFKQVNGTSTKQILISGTGLAEVQ